MLDTIPRFLFTGQELDEENGMYYYSARYYAPPTFISRDPLFEDYPTFSPYCYTANNPVKYVDPTGMDIELNFYDGKNKENSSEALKQTINQGLGGQFEAYYTKGKSGTASLQLRATEGGGNTSKMSDEQKAFYNELSSMIKDQSTTAVIDVKYGSANVTIGNYRDNAIDIADINQFDNMGKGAATRQGKLIHEFAEQFGKAKSGSQKGSDKGYEDNHQRGISAENRVNGSTRGRESYSPRGGQYSTSYSDKKGNTTTYSYGTRDPIIKVRKTAL
jgi:RHS repeat-associated protein